jgi:hypothetical protein
VGARGPAQHSYELAIRGLKPTKSIGLPLQTDRDERLLPSAGLRPLEEEETVPKPLADHRLAHIISHCTSSSTSSSHRTLQDFSLPHINSCLPIGLSRWSAQGVLVPLPVCLNVLRTNVKRENSRPKWPTLIRIQKFRDRWIHDQDSCNGSFWKTPARLIHDVCKTYGT